MYFTIESGSGGYFFRIKAANHETLAHSEIYNQKASAQNAINVIKGGAAGAQVIDNT